MDLCFKRYANPFIFLDNMLLVGRFSEWVDETWHLINEEKEEVALWQFYLYKINDKSFNEFKENLEKNIKNSQTTEAELEATIKESRNILGGFIPK